MKKILLLLLISIPSLSLLTAQEYSFTTDKQLHFIGGGVLGSAGYLVAYELTEGNRFVSYLGGTASAGTVGLLKEVYDSRRGGSGFNGADLAYTALGGLVSSIITDLVINKQSYRKRRLRREFKRMIKISERYGN